MRVTIIIECETCRELDSHLCVIRKEIRDLSTTMESGLDGPLPIGSEIVDSNCYGDHIVNVEKQ